MYVGTRQHGIPLFVVSHRLSLSVSRPLSPPRAHGSLRPAIASRAVRTCICSFKSGARTSNSRVAALRRWLKAIGRPARLTARLLALIGKGASCADGHCDRDGSDAGPSELMLP